MNPKERTRRVVSAGDKKRVVDSNHRDSVKCQGGRAAELTTATKPHPAIEVNRSASVVIKPGRPRR